MPLKRVPSDVAEHQLDPGRAEPGERLHRILRRALHDVEAGLGGGTAEGERRAGDRAIREHRVAESVRFRPAPRRRAPPPSRRPRRGRSQAGRTPLPSDRASGRPRRGRFAPRSLPPSFARDLARGPTPACGWSCRRAPRRYASSPVPSGLARPPSPRSCRGHLGPHAGDAAVDLHARPPEPVRREAARGEMAAHRVVVGLLAAVLQQHRVAHAPVREVAGEGLEKQPGRSCSTRSPRCARARRSATRRSTAAGSRRDPRR